VIASGEGQDLRTAGGMFGTGHFEISNSNFDSTKLMAGSTLSGTANQTAPPLFVDAPGADYREAPGSPTIDAGVADPQIGALDLDGNARAQGAAPDIGAFEATGSSQPPPPSAVITSLRVSPRKFHPAKAAATTSCFQKYKEKGASGPRCTSFHFDLTGPAAAAFSIERGLPGRRVGGKCRRPTAATKKRKRCARFRSLSGEIVRNGTGGANSFTFSGWLAGRKLKAGPYRLLGSAGGAVKQAGFRVVK
jgi:hypothetical protein